MYDLVHRLDDDSRRANLALAETPIENPPTVEPGPMEGVALVIVTLLGIAVWALILNAIWGTLANV